ncbi:MAG: DNA ligase [Sulfurospirillaceae bacterium]|nr:DNA ligase [Sulfurospirillaceae bacterium]
MKFVCSLVFLCCFAWGAKPELLLLETYKDQNISGWLMSEKLDGIRAYWDGKSLVSRSGRVFAAPKWFTKDFPLFKLDGELWSKQGDFEAIQSIVMQKEPHQGWEKLTYNIFEVPEAKGNLIQRLALLKEPLPQYLRVVPQFTCKDKAHLAQFLKEVETKGGEGVVLRNPQTPYIAKRDDSALKVKTFYDAECEVIAHHKGQGKYKNLLGSLTCKGEKGMTFDVGSGFSDEERKNPPKVGTQITYKYQEITKAGKPRFPVFLRVKEEI